MKKIKDSKKIWEAIKAIIDNNKNTKKSRQISLYVNSVITTDDKAIANHLKKFFTSITNKLIKKIPYANRAYHDYLKNPNEKSLFMPPANPEETEKVIKFLKVNKAIGPNSISPVILRNFKKELSLPLCLIVNLSFSEGIFPDPLKCAKGIPICKKEDPLNCNNYRSISILSNFSKVFEKLMYCRLHYFLEQHDCLYTQQFTFRNSHSTNQALINITEIFEKLLTTAILHVVYFS